MESFNKVYSWPNILLTVAGFVIVTGLGNYFFSNNNLNYLLFMFAVAGVLAIVWFLLKCNTTKRQ